MKTYDVKIRLSSLPLSPINSIEDTLNMRFGDVEFEIEDQGSATFLTLKRKAEDFQQACIKAMKVMNHVGLRGEVDFNNYG